MLRKRVKRRETRGGKEDTTQTWKCQSRAARGHTLRLHATHSYKCQHGHFFFLCVCFCFTYSRREGVTRRMRGKWRRRKNDMDERITHYLFLFFSRSYLLLFFFFLIYTVFILSHLRSFSFSYFKFKKMRRRKV